MRRGDGACLPASVCAKAASRSRAPTTNCLFIADAPAERRTSYRLGAGPECALNRWRRTPPRSDDCLFLAWLAPECLVFFGGGTSAGATASSGAGDPSVKAATLGAACGDGLGLFSAGVALAVLGLTGSTAVAAAAGAGAEACGATD